MEYDPATEEFLRYLKEDREVKGTDGQVWDGSRGAPAKKATFKGNYGGGTEFHQMDPDLEYENLTKRALGTDLNDLDERPGSMMVNDEDEPGETTELEVDTGDGAATKKGRPFAAPEGFTKITDGLPVSKDAPGKTKPGKELGETYGYGDLGARSAQEKRDKRQHPMDAMRNRRNRALDSCAWCGGHIEDAPVGNPYGGVDEGVCKDCGNAGHADCMAGHECGANDSLAGFQVVGEDVEQGCCGHPAGHHPIGCEEMAEFKDRHGYVPCLRDHMAGDLCSRRLGHEGWCDAETIDDMDLSFCQSCSGEGCETCFDAPIGGQDDGRPMGSNGPQNGITHESRGTLDDAIAEAIGDTPLREALKPVGLSWPGSPMTPDGPPSGDPSAAMAGHCAMCDSPSGFTCDMCKEVVCDSCEYDHDVTRHGGHKDTSFKPPGVSHGGPAIQGGQDDNPPAHSGGPYG